MNENIIYSGVVMIRNVKQLKQFLEKQDDSKTLSIVPIDDDNLDNWINYSKKYDYVEIIDGGEEFVGIATLSP